MNILPDPTFQDAIASVMHAPTEGQRAALVEHLGGMDDTSHERLVHQLLYYANQAENTKDAMAAGVILARLEVPDDAVVRALVPLLETTDAALDRSVRNLLGGFEGRAAGRSPDFSAYREIIAEQLRAGEAPPRGLVRYMYASAPGEALLTMMRAQQLRQPAEIKTILWAEHTVADVIWQQQYGFLSVDRVEPAAAEELAKLARHEAWWARLYVAEIMRQYPAFQRADLVERLTDDAHVLVREAAVAANEERKKESQE